jgi:hypothetical protein
MREHKSTLSRQLDLEDREVWRKLLPLFRNSVADSDQKLQLATKAAISE